MKHSEAIEIYVHPTKSGSTTYRFHVKNKSDLPVEDIKFDFYDILGPIDFNLDDTHMPATLTKRDIFEVSSLAANESVSIELKKWGSIDKYNGDFEKNHIGNFIAKCEYNPKSIFQDRTTKRLVKVFIHSDPE